MRNAIFYISQMASRQLDELEEDEIRQFIKRGCGCAIKCSSFFPLEKIQAHRNNIQEMEQAQKDMIILSLFHFQLDPLKQSEKVNFQIHGKLL